VPTHPGVVGAAYRSTRSSQRFELPPASRARCDGREAVSFHHRSVPWRLVALDVPAPELIRCRGQELGPHLGRVNSLIAPLLGLAAAGEQALHRAHGTQVGAFVEQLGVDLRRRPTGEAGLVQHRQHLLLLRLRERTRRRAPRAPTDWRSTTPVEAPARQADRVACSGYPQVRCGFCYGLHQRRSPFSSSSIPRMDATCFGARRLSLRARRDASSARRRARAPPRAGLDRSARAVSSRVAWLRVRPARLSRAPCARPPGARSRAPPAGAGHRSRPASGSGRPPEGSSACTRP